jgi:hypothetical protein
VGSRLTACHALVSDAAWRVGTIQGCGNFEGESCADREGHRLRTRAASTSAWALRTLWRDEQPNPQERATERAFERARVIWPLFAYRRRGWRIGICSRSADRRGRVAPPAANPSQTTGRVKRHGNQLHRARVLKSANPVPSNEESANFRSLNGRRYPESATNLAGVVIPRPVR